MKWGHSIKGKTPWIATEVWKRKSQSMCKREELALPVPRHTLQPRLPEGAPGLPGIDGKRQAHAWLRNSQPVFNLHLCFIKYSFRSLMYWFSKASWCFCPNSVESRIWGIFRCVSSQAARWSSYMSRGKSRKDSMESCCWKLWTQLCSKLNRFLPSLLGKNLGHFPTLYSIFLLLPKQRFLKNKHTHRFKKKNCIEISASNQTHQSPAQKAQVSCEWSLKWDSAQEPHSMLQYSWSGCPLIKSGLLGQLSRFLGRHRCPPSTQQPWWTSEFPGWHMKGRGDSVTKTSQIVSCSNCETHKQKVL